VYRCVCSLKVNSIFRILQSGADIKKYIALKQKVKQKSYNNSEFLISLYIDKVKSRYTRISKTLKLIAWHSNLN
jgi:hypothetical protein